jgi:hypothetical protein
LSRSSDDWHAVKVVASASALRMRYLDFIGYG